MADPQAPPPSSSPSTPPALRPDLALLLRTSLATGLVAAFLYGMFIVLFIASTYFLVLRHMKGTGNNKVRFRTFLTPTIVFNCLMFVTVTASTLLVCVRVFEAFLTFQGGTNPLGFYGDLSHITEVVKTAFILSSVTIGDCMMMYRLWVVWDHNYYVIAFPFVCILALVACSVGLTYQFSQFVVGQPVFDSAAGRWITSDCIFTLCTNLYSTALIIWRIWKINRATLSYGGRKLASPLVMLVESAAVFTSWAFLLFITYHTQTNFQFFAVDTIAIISGISFMLINVRVGLGSALKGDQFATTTVHSSITFPTSQGPITSVHGHGGPGGGAYSVGGGKKNSAYPMAPLAINIDRVVEADHRDMYKEGSMLPKMASSRDGTPV